MPSQNAPAPAKRTAEELRPTNSTNQQAAPRHSTSANQSEELRRCVFWKLPYFDPMLTSSYDAMHTLGGLVSDLFGCMAGEESEKVRLYELQENK